MRHELIDSSSNCRSESLFSRIITFKRIRKWRKCGTWRGRVGRVEFLLVGLTNTVIANSSFEVLLHLIYCISFNSLLAH